MWIYRILQDIIDNWEGQITKIEVYEGWANDFESETTITLQQKFSEINIVLIPDKKLEIK